MSEQVQQAEKAEKAPEQQLEIHRVYVKDASLETPNTPDIFKQEWKPEISMDLDIRHNALEENAHEVVLSITVKAEMDEKIVFLVEVHQAGIFGIKGFKEAELDHILKAYCPTILFPYAREVVSDLIVRASLPQLPLAPINFEMLYMQQQKEAAKSSGETGGETKH